MRPPSTSVINMISSIPCVLTAKLNNGEIP
ncbi:hypothetical protein VPHD249_0191 [Vibrio phage D249]